VGGCLRRALGHRVGVVLAFLAAVWGRLACAGPVSVRFWSRTTLGVFGLVVVSAGRVRPLFRFGW